MPKQQIKDYSGGINTRLNKHRIAENEAQNAVDVDLSGAKLKPTKTTDTTNPPSGDKKFKGSWVTDADATKFEEYGDVLIKSYDTKDPEFSTASDSTSKTLGVASKPSQAVTASVESSGSTPTTDALAYHTVETDSLSNTASLPNALITEVLSSSTAYADTRTDKKDTLSPVFKAGDYYYFFTNTSGSAKVEKWSDSAKIAEVSVTHTDGNNTIWNRNDTHLVSLNSTKTHVSVVTLNSDNANSPTATDVTLQTIPSAPSSYFSDTTLKKYELYGQKETTSSPATGNSGYESWNAGTVSIGMSDSKAQISRSYSGNQITGLRAREVSSSETWNFVKAKSINHEGSTDQIVWQLPGGSGRIFMFGGWIPLTELDRSHTTGNYYTNGGYHRSTFTVTNHIRVNTSDNLGWYLSTALDNSGTDGSLLSGSVGGTTYISNKLTYPYVCAHNGGFGNSHWSRQYKAGGSTVTRDSVFAVWCYQTTTSNPIYLKWNGDYAFCIEFDNTLNTSFQEDPFDVSQWISPMFGGGAYNSSSFNRLAGIGPGYVGLLSEYPIRSGQIVRSYGWSASRGMDYLNSPLSNPTIAQYNAMLSNHSNLLYYYATGGIFEVEGDPPRWFDAKEPLQNTAQSRWCHWGMSYSELTPTSSPALSISSLRGKGGNGTTNVGYIYGFPFAPIIFHDNTVKTVNQLYTGQQGGIGKNYSRTSASSPNGEMRHAYENNQENSGQTGHSTSVRWYGTGTSNITATWSNIGSSGTDYTNNANYLGNLKDYGTSNIAYGIDDNSASYISMTAGTSRQFSLIRSYFYDWKFISILNANNQGLDIKITSNGQVYLNTAFDSASEGNGTYDKQYLEKLAHRASYLDQITLSNASKNSLVYPEAPTTASNYGYTRTYPDESLDYDKVHGSPTSHIVAKRNLNSATDSANVLDPKVFTQADSATAVSTIQGGTNNTSWGSSTERVYADTHVLPYDGTNFSSYALTGSVNQGTTSVATFKKAEIKNAHLVLSGSTDGYAIIPFANLAGKITASDHTGVSVYAGTSSVQDVATAFFDSSNNLTHTFYASGATTAKLYQVSGTEVSLFNIPTTSGLLGLNIDTSNNQVLAFVNSTASALSTFKKFNYVFSSGLTAKTIRDSTTNSLSGVIYKVLTDAGNANKKYILVDVSTYHLFNTSGLEINIYGSTWLPITAIGKTNTLSLTSGMSSTSSIGTSVGLTQSLMRQIQVGDVVTGGSNTTTVSAKTASGTTLTLANTQNNNAGVTLTFTRFVQKNTAWIISSDINNVKVAGSPPNYSALYTNPESIAFASFTNIEHQPLNKSTSALDGATTYYLVVFDKNLTDVDSEAQNGISIDLETYVVGASNMFNADGPNLGFQYKYSQLRNIGTTSEPVLIEGPVSDASESVTIGTTQDFIRLSNFQGSPASDITAYRVYRVGGDFASYGWLADVDVSSSVPSNYDDSARIITSTSLTPLQYANPVPTASGKFLKHITNVSGIFFGAFDAQLRFSEFGNPHSWPTTGFTDLDGTITGIVEYQGEGIVFTPNATYRVRGNNFESMSVVKLPEQQGVPAGNVNSIVNVNNTIFFISNDGLCAYAGGRINVISQGKLNPFPTITNVKGASKDNVLFFFGSSGQGLACDLRRGQPIFSKLTETVDQRAFYVQEEDRLYLKKSSNGGAFQEGATDNSIIYQSRTYDFADANEYKVYKRAQVTYKGSGSITFTFDETINETFNLSSSSNELARYLEFSVARTAKQVEYEVTGQIEVIEMSFDADALTTYDTEVRFENIDVTYKGDPTIEIQIDGSVMTMTPTLISSNNVRTMRLYFPSATQGYLPHYRNSGITGDIMSVKYNTSEL